MHLLLINVGRKSEIRIPQGLLYLASALKNSEHKVTIHDENLAENPQSSLRQILACKPDAVGLSVYSVPSLLRRIEQISKALKENSKSAPVIWGGWHPTLYPQQSILNENVDIVVKGPAEKILFSLLDALEKKHPLRKIPNLLYKENGEIIQTKSEPFDPDSLYPPLDFKLIDIDAYLKKHDAGEGTLQYLTTRGCYGNCRFCIVSKAFEHRIIRKPQMQAAFELKYLIRKHNVSAIHFSDDNTFSNNQQALRLCNIIRIAADGKTVPWRCSTRIDSLAQLSNDTLKKLKQNKCKGFVLGIESGNDKVLRMMRKGTTVKQIKKALKSLLDNDIERNLFFFLFNFTGESQKQARQTLTLARRTRLMFPYSDIALSVYFPGASDSTWLPENIPPRLASKQSKIFENYYNRHIKNYRLKGKSLKILRFYFAACKRKNYNSRKKTSSLRKLYKISVLLRIKTGLFIFPWEYYLSNFPLKKVRRHLKAKSAE